MSLSNRRQMQLSELLEGISVMSAAQDVQVTGISEYSKDIEKGDLFLACNDLCYCHEAIANGAVAVAYDASVNCAAPELLNDVPMIACENLTHHISDILVRFYGDQGKRINTIAITGTDGKTSVAHLVAQALDYSGDACGLVGTLGLGRLNDLAEATHTTPPKTRMAKEYAKFAEMDCEFVALEASSHGIHQGRLTDLTIHTAVLTNITRDHLDYHKTLDNYIQAKAALFFQHDAKFAVINIDDEVGRQWCKQLDQLVNVVSYSLNNTAADVYASRIEYMPDSTNVDICLRNEVIEINIKLLGEFNVLNILAVAAVLISLQKTNRQIVAALSNLESVPGRMQRVINADKENIIVDYAHTPAALLAAINAVRQHTPGKLTCVFGCGGDRDQGKRAQMGRVASTHCDYVVITSDNPRHESAETIIQHIVQGCVDNSSYTAIADRKEAIKHALHERSDAVLIAGKGHEKYQYIGDQRLDFDDMEVVQEELQRIAHG